MAAITLISNVTLAEHPSKPNKNNNKIKQVTAPAIMVYILEYNKRQYYLLLL